MMNSSNSEIWTWVVETITASAASPVSTLRLASLVTWALVSTDHVGVVLVQFVTHVSWSLCSNGDNSWQRSLDTLLVHLFNQQFSVLSGDKILQCISPGHCEQWRMQQLLCFNKVYKLWRRNHICLSASFEVHPESQLDNWIQDLA